MAMPAHLAALVAKSKGKYVRSSSRLKPKEGQNRYRFLISDAIAWVDMGVHWIKTAPDTANPSGKVIAVVGCEEIVNDQPCAICTAVDRAIASALTDVDKKFYEEWKVRKSVLINALDRSKGSSNPNLVQILELTTTTMGEVLNIVQQYADAGQNIFDAKEGIDIVITKSGKGLGTTYSVNQAAGVSEPVDPALFSDMHDLNAHIQAEFFRGDDRKALNAIAAASGVSVAGLLGPATSGPVALARAPALTAGGASVDAAALEAIVPPTPAAPALVPATVATVASVAPVVETPVVAAVAPPVASVVAAAPAAPVVDADDLDSILAGLDEIQ